MTKVRGDFEVALVLVAAGFEDSWHLAFVNERGGIYESCMNGDFFDRTFRSVQVDELSYDDDFVDAAELLIDYHYRAQGRGQRVTTVSY